MKTPTVTLTLTPMEVRALRAWRNFWWSCRYQRFSKRAVARLEAKLAIAERELRDTRKEAG